MQDERLEREVISLRAWRHDADRQIAQARARIFDLERRVGELERYEPDVTRARVGDLARAVNWLRGSYVGLLFMLTTLFSALFASGKL